MQDKIGIPDLEAGEVILTDCGLYDHYGIYVGNNEVVHFSAGRENRLSSKHAYIQKTSLDEFMENGLKVERMETTSAYTREQVVLRALEKVGSGRGEYDLLFNNCEHFAHWCKYGSKESKQVKQGVKAA